MKLVGRQHDIASGRSGLSAYKVAKYREQFATLGFELPALDVKNVIRNSVRANQHREPVGTALKSRIEGLLKIKSGKGCGCQNLATQMDGWGIAGCERERETIVNALVSNRDMLVESLKDWMGSVAGSIASVVPDAVLRTGATWLLDQAIQDVRNQPRPQRPVRAVNRKSRHEYTGWRSEADGPPTEFGPFVSRIRHLTYFVYGRSEESWKWNLDELAKRWWLFNGKKILGIAHDGKSAKPQAVIDYAASLGMVFDDVVTASNNEKLREVVLWVPMLERLHPTTAAADEVVFSAHAKGQKYDDPKHTRDWCDLMYQSCLDDWPAVYNALRTSLFAGSFREYGLLGKNSNWAYSGTFYWWRLAEIGKRNWRDVDRWFAGTESWPSKMCEANETACLFLNDSRRLYDTNYWLSTVWPEWAKYQEKMRGR
jgi:hypothetical protein